MRKPFRTLALLIALAIGFVIVGAPGGCNNPPPPPSISAVHTHCSWYDFSFVDFPTDANVTIHSEVWASRVGSPEVKLVEHNDFTILQSHDTKTWPDTGTWQIPNGAYQGHVKLSWNINGPVETSFLIGGLCPFEQG